MSDHFLTFCRPPLRLTVYVPYRGYHPIHVLRVMSSCVINEVSTEPRQVSGCDLRALRKGDLFSRGTVGYYERSVKKCNENCNKTYARESSLIRKHDAVVRRDETFDLASTKFYILSRLTSLTSLYLSYRNVV